MFDLSFEINGRRVQPNQIANALEKAMVQQITDSVKKSVGSIRCPVHGKHPSIKCVGRSIENLSLEVSGCCDELVKKATEKLS